MQVLALWRYPVKGLLGEAADELSLDERGVTGDRAWAIYGADGKIASGKTTRRFRRMPDLFTMSSRTDGDDVVVTVDGWSGSVRDPETAHRIAAVVGEPVTLRREGAVRHHDEGGVHVVTTADVRAAGDADHRRFRPNVLLEAEPLETGREIVLDGVVLRVTGPMPRCVMTTLAQPAHGLGFEPGLGRITELGVVAEVVTPGTILSGPPR